MSSPVTSGEGRHRQPRGGRGPRDVSQHDHRRRSAQGRGQLHETISEPIFGNGEAVFLREWPGTYGDIAGGTYKIKQEQVAVSPIPVAPGNPTASTLGGWDLLINAQPDMPDEAWEFVKFMTSFEQLQVQGYRRWLHNGPKGDPGRPQVQEAIPTVKLAKDVLLEYATSRPVTQYYGDMSLEMQSQFNDALTGDVSPEQAVETLQKNLTSIMKQAD